MPTTKNKNTNSVEGFVCEYCQRSLKHETSFLKHMCETKRRFVSRDEKPNRMAFMIFQKMWKRSSPYYAKPKEYAEFVKSPYFKSLFEFAKYMNDINAVKPESFVEFLLKGEYHLHRWHSPTLYQTYIRELARKESPLEAVERNFLLMQQWAQDTGEDWTDFFRKIAPTQATAWIISGRLSPWVLYVAPSAPSLLERFSEEQISMIHTSIEPKFWAIKIKVNSQAVAIIQDQLKAAGL